MECRLFPEGTIPEHTTAAWYEGRDHAPHVEEAAHRGRLDIAARFINEFAWDGAGPEEPLLTVSDLGCGDGGLLSLLDDRVVSGWGYDLQKTNVEASKARGVDVRYGDIVEGFNDLELGRLCVTTELLEHLVSPRDYVKRLYDAGVEYLVASSPYTETPGNAYLFHTWCFDIDGYSAMLTESGFRPVRTETWSMFQVHFCERV